MTVIASANSTRIAHWLLPFIIASFIVVLSCGGDNADVEVLEVTVGPEMVDCVGVGPMKCLVVDGELFYDPIDGFEHEEGYTYRLKIERFNQFPEDEEPPQDASLYGYRLLEVISKTPQ